MEQLAYTGPTGKTHTMNCATVQHWDGGGDKRGASPDLRSTPMAEAMEHLKKYPSAECGRCRAMRLKADAEHNVTADGTPATPVEGEPLKWLVRVTQHTWWVIELHSRETRIQDVDLNDTSFSSPWGICATTCKITRQDGSEHPGWYTEVEGNAVGPYSRMDDAVGQMLAEMAQNRARREQKAAERAVENKAPLVASDPQPLQTSLLAAEDFRPGWRYWSVYPGYEDAWTIASVRIFESPNSVRPDGERYTTLVEHIRRDGDTRVFELGEKIAIQGPWKTEA